ncbi:MAG: c-type cytochrome biogenesis protein CcmI [Colwellia sp.]|nr:c-type cytochrome biogenesis protein CcmI [Colwellia sp.]
MEIALILLVFIALLLWVIWQPFFQQDSTQQEADKVANMQKGVREQTNIDLYHEHKAEIEKDFNNGSIDEENYQYLLVELDNSLLQDIDSANQTPNPMLSVKPNSIKPFGLVWPILLSLFIIIFSSALYLKQGTLKNLMATPVASQESQQSMPVNQQKQVRQQKMLDYINDMKKYLVEKPDDSEAWYNLGKVYVSAGEFDLAIAAFEQVIRIEGEHADLLGAIAQARYYQNNQKIDAQVQSLIDKALALDINDPSTNILLGMYNFTSQKYQQAIGYWQRVIDTKRQGVNIEALQEAVDEAKARLKKLSLNGSLNESSMVLAPTAIANPQLKVSVSLSADIADKLAQGEDKVVFVYAIPTNGKRMPLAAIKLMASDLPKVITLSNNQAMSPQNNLSSVDRVHIFAIVSKQGGAGIKAGDFKGKIDNVAVNNKETISLVISNIVE